MWTFITNCFSCDPLPSCFEGKALEGSFGGCRRHGVEARAFDYSRIADACLIEKDMKTHLRAQMPSGVGSDVVVESVIDTLDEDGYFRGEVAAIAFECDVEEPDVRLVLDAVRSAEPAGVGGDGSDRLPEIASCSIAFASWEGWHTLCSIAFLMTSLKSGLDRSLVVWAFPVRDVIAAMEAIRKCDPCPGRAFTKEAIAYTHPDIIIERREGKWSVSVFGATNVSAYVKRVVSCFAGFESR